MLDDFMFRAILAGIAVAIASAPLGCFIVWRRMAYFGDATAHAAILGVALALAFESSIFIGTVIVALIMASIVSALSHRGYVMDSLLGVLAHSALAIGLVAVSMLSGVRVDLMAYLFGDILAVSPSDLVLIWSGALLIVALLVWRWSALLASTLNAELAYSMGYDPKKEDRILTLALALTIAVAIKVVGVLFIGAMLLIPTVAARNFSKIPETMAVVSAFIGSLCVIIGLRSAYLFDTPAGPTIICVASVIFAISAIFGLRKFSN